MDNILEYKGFYGSVVFSAEDSVFFGTIIGTADLVTFEGDSVEVLKKAFKEAVEDYLALCEEVGKDALKSFKGSFNVRITPEIHRQAFIQAALKKISLNTFVEEAISEKVTKSTNA